MKRVFAFGTFDGLHNGHVSYLHQAAAQGDSLTVVIGRDERVKQIKGQKPVLSETQRVQLIESTGLADRVMLGGTGQPLEIFNSEQIDVAVLGFDQKFSEQALEQAAAKSGQHTRVVRARAFMPFIFQNHVLKHLGWIGRLLRKDRP